MSKATRSSRTPPRTSVATSPCGSATRVAPPSPEPKVYFEGDFLGLTGGVGTITAPSALVGDEVIALSQVHEEPAVKPGHSNYGSSNWAWRAYQTNLGFTPAGVPQPHTVGDIHATQQLTVRRDRALIGFHMLVSVQFDATPAFLANLRQGLEIASDFLYDVGDGQFFFEVVEVFDNGAFFASGCDMEVHASINGRANAGRAGITTGVDAHINMARYGEQITNSWAVGSGARTIIHEVGHYGLHLYDEYLARDNVSWSHCATDFGTTPVDRRASIMFDQNTASEMCTDVDPNHQHRSQTQHDAQTGGETTWETTQRIYSDSTSPERWRILTPDDRLAVMPGPDGLPISSWTRVYVTDADSGACAPFTVTLVETQLGSPAAQAKIWLDRPFRQPDLVQGFTNAAGQIEIVGAHNGDVLTAKKGGREGSTLVNCTQMAGRTPLTIEPTVFDLDVAVFVAADDTVRIDVAASVPLAASPLVELWQSGSAATTAVDMSYIPDLGLYTGQVDLDDALQAGGYVSALAADQSSNTVSELQEFELHEVTTDGAASRCTRPTAPLSWFSHRGASLRTPLSRSGPWRPHLPRRMSCCASARRTTSHFLKEVLSKRRSLCCAMASTQSRDSVHRASTSIDGMTMVTNGCPWELHTTKPPECWRSRWTNSVCTPCSAIRARFSPTVLKLATRRGGRARPTSRDWHQAQR